MLGPSASAGFVAYLSASLVFSAGEDFKSRWQSDLTSRLKRAANVWRTAAPKQEKVFLGGCFLMFWLMSAASFSGYIILALFMLVAVGRCAKYFFVALAERFPRRSRSRHYLIACVSAAFFSLLIVRACYIASVIVDSQFRANPFEIYNARK
jgi:hypothetical protein